MADRAEDIKEMEALDQRVDELLADVEQTAGRLDAAIPAPPGDDSAFEFESADEVLGTVSQDLACAQTPPAAELTADEALAEVAAEMAADETQSAPPAPAEPRVGAHAATKDAVVVGQVKHTHATAAPAPTPTASASPVPADEPDADEPADMSAAEFASPEAITKLDEKLAATAAELSSHGSDVVDDQETQAALMAEEAHAPAAPRPAQATAAPAQVAAPPAPVPGPVPVAAVAAPTPTPAPKPVPAAIVEEKPRQPRTGLGGVAAAAIRPLANFTLNLQPGTRQTIAYAAVVTLFQAACLWGFLAFKGPSADLAPTSEPVILRQPGDPSAPPKQPAAKKAASAKPKESAKADAGGH